jgi:hypothetical protein
MQASADARVSAGVNVQVLHAIIEIPPMGVLLRLRAQFYR